MFQQYIVFIVSRIIMIQTNYDSPKSDNILTDALPNLSVWGHEALLLPFGKQKLLTCQMEKGFQKTYNCVYK